MCDVNTEAGCGAGQCLYGAALHTLTSRQSLPGRTAISIISTHNIYTHLQCRYVSDMDHVLQ